MEKPDSPENKEGDKDYVFPSLHEAEQPAVASAPEPKPSRKPPAILLTAKVWVTKRKSLSLVIAFVIIALLMWGVSKWRESASVDPEDPVASGVDEIPVNVIETRLQRFQDQITAVGTLRGEREVELRFEVDGKINEFNVSEGARVGRGQLIARLDQADARDKLDLANNEVQQNEILFNAGGISKIKLNESRSKLRSAQRELDKTEIRVPKNIEDGILGDRSAEVGEFVTPQRKIATLVAIKNMEVKVGVIEKQVDKVFPGQKLLVTVDAYPGNVFDGTIETISPIIQGQSKTFEITAKIPNAESLLLPGMFVRTKIITYEADDAVAVPNDALSKTASGFEVFVVNKDNIAEAREVTVGYVATEFTQIESGLSPGEVVVVQKPPELKAGSKVKIIEVQK